MRLIIVTVAIVMLASFVGVDKVVPTPLQAADRVAEVLGAAKKALGGEDKLAAVKGISAEGPFRRSMGPRDMEGTATLLIVRPDKFRRVEEMQMGGMVGGPSIERTSTLAGNNAWDDMQNRGAMGGGMQMIIRDGPPPPPPAPGAAPSSAPAPPTPEQLNQARVQRMKIQMQRYLAAMFAEGPQAWTDAGIAESPDGKADILEAKEESGRTIRLFIDQATHLPLMVQYQDPKPNIMINGGPGGPGRGGPGGPGGGMVMVGPGGGGSGEKAVAAGGGGGNAAGVERKAAAMAGGDGQRPTPEEMQKRIDEMRRAPVQMGTFAMHLSEYKKVDGIMLPTKIETSLDNEPSEEWTIEKYKINPSVKADTWEHKQ